VGLVIHLGVTDLPYAQAPGRRRRNKPVKSGTQTTGDVAGWLENRYHVIEHFLQLHGDAIGAALEQGLADTLEAALTGAPKPDNLIAGASGEIEELFRRMLESRELDALGYPGIPTKAAQSGVNPRLKRKRGDERPSFIATGLYSNSFKIWADEE
jgi:hypothetical protein